jgi:cytoskeletal protein CcmA (bactofilin family)
MDVITDVKRYPVERRAADLENKIVKTEKNVVSGGGSDFNGVLDGELTVKGTGLSSFKGSVKTDSALEVGGALRVNTIDTNTSGKVVVGNSLETSQNLKAEGKLEVKGDADIDGVLTVGSGNTDVLRAIGKLESKTEKIECVEGATTITNGILKIESN